MDSYIQLISLCIPVNECIGGDEEEGAVFVLIAPMLLPPADPPAAAQTKSLLSLPPDANH